MSLLALVKIGRTLANDKSISTSWSELWVYPIPAALYLVKNLLQYYVFLYGRSVVSDFEELEHHIDWDFVQNLLEEDLERGSGRR